MLHKERLGGRSPSYTLPLIITTYDADHKRNTLCDYIDSLAYTDGSNSIKKDEYRAIERADKGQV